MKIQYNTDNNIKSEERQEEYFTAQIADGLSRYQSHISRLEVHLSDENGKKDGFKDILCLLEGRIHGRQPIAVSCQADTIALAVSGAIDKLKNSLESILGQIKNY